MIIREQKSLIYVYSYQSLLPRNIRIDDNLTKGHTTLRRRWASAVGVDSALFQYRVLLDLICVYGYHPLLLRATKIHNDQRKHDQRAHSFETTLSRRYRRWLSAVSTLCACWDSCVCMVTSIYCTGIVRYIMINDSRAKMLTASRRRRTDTVGVELM